MSKFLESNKMATGVAISVATGAVIFGLASIREKQPDSKGSKEPAKEQPSYGAQPDTQQRRYGYEIRRAGVPDFCKDKKIKAIAVKAMGNTVSCETLNTGGKMPSGVVQKEYDWIAKDRKKVIGIEVLASTNPNYTVTYAHPKGGKLQPTNVDGAEECDFVRFPLKQDVSYLLLGCQVSDSLVARVNLAPKEADSVHLSKMVMETVISQSGTRTAPVI